MRQKEKKTVSKHSTVCLSPINSHSCLQLRWPGPGNQDQQIQSGPGSGPGPIRTWDNQDLVQDLIQDLVQDRVQSGPGPIRTWFKIWFWIWFRTWFNQCSDWSRIQFGWRNKPMQHQLTFEWRKCCFIKTFEAVKHIGMNTKGHMI